MSCNCHDEKLLSLDVMSSNWHEEKLLSHDIMSSFCHEENCYRWTYRICPEEKLAWV
jgi:hypothetical protein